MPKPHVTVLLDTYNHERFIEEAIVSALEQDFAQAETEIVAVDDGSTDRTPEIIRKFAPRVRLLHKANGGQASAFNAGIREAMGEIVAFLDGDDWWAKNKLSRVVSVLDQHPEIGFVGHGNISVYLDGRASYETLREGHRFRANTTRGALLFRVRKNFLGTSRMTIRAGILRKIGSVPEALRIQADEFLFTLAAVLCDVEVLPDALTYYRLHDSNLFMIDRQHPERMRVKQFVLDVLAKYLAKQLAVFEVDSGAIDIIVESVQTEADQLRLMLDGGFPWETVRTEFKIQGILSRQATRAQRLFRFARILPAVLMPPRWYYQWRCEIGQSALYQQARAKYLPIPQPPHVQRVAAVGQGMNSK